MTTRWRSAPVRALEEESEKERGKEGEWGAPYRTPSPRKSSAAARRAGDAGRTLEKVSEEVRKREGNRDVPTRDRGERRARRADADADEGNGDSKPALAVWLWRAKVPRG